MSQADTKTRILDAAEQLFARDGYHITSLRTLTELADVNLAAVNYHFGSKEGLLQAVFERRLIPLNSLRQHKIEAVLSRAKSNAQPPAARELLEAFIEPTIAFRNSGPGAKDFIALIGRSISEPDESVRNCFLQQVMPIFKLLLESLQLALPKLPAHILLTRLQFTMGAMSHMLCNSVRSEQLAPELAKTLGDEKLTTELVTFVCSGLEAPC